MNHLSSVILCSILLFLLFSGAQAQQPLLLPASVNGELILGAVDRFVVPALGKWEVIMAPDGLSFSSGVYLYTGGVVFVGTQGKGLYIQSAPFQQGSQEVVFKTMAQGLSGDYVNCLEKNAAGLWVGTDGGLSLMEGERFVTFSPWNSSLPAGPVNFLVANETGDGVWAVTKTGGALVGSDLSVVPWPVKNSPPPSQILSAGLWDGKYPVLAVPDGLFLLKDGAWNFMNLPFSAVSLRFVPQKGLVAGTLKGLYLISSFGREPVNIFTQENSKSMFLSGTNLWITTDAGVSVAGNTQFLPAGNVAVFENTGDARE